MLSKEAIVCYKIDNIFNLDYCKEIKFDDPKIKIEWKLKKNNIILSDKDRNAPYFIG